VRNAQLFNDPERRGAANSVNIGERDDHALVGGDIDPGNTSHLFLHAPQGLGHFWAASPYLNAQSFYWSPAPTICALQDRKQQKFGRHAQRRCLPNLVRTFRMRAAHRTIRAGRQPQERAALNLTQAARSILCCRIVKS